MDVGHIQETVEEELWLLKVEVADQQAGLDRLLAAVQRLEKSQLLPQILFQRPPSGRPRDIWEAAALPEEFTEEQLGDMLCLLEKYILNEGADVVPDGKWLEFLYTLFEYSLAKIDS